MYKLTDKVVLITGASKGIGAATAKLLASQGAKVVINYASNSLQAEKVVHEITLAGGTAIAIKADVSLSANVTYLFDEVIAAFGKIDAVVNNAGIGIFKALQDTTDEDFDRVFDLNVKGVFNTMRAAATRLENNGRIVNISSSTTRVLLPTYGTYSATKAAVEQMTRVFAKEVGSRGITVNAVCPGPVNTELFHEGKTPETVARLASMSAFNRIGETSDIAKVIAFLLSEDAQWITAQNLGANGGFA